MPILRFFGVALKAKRKKDFSDYCFDKKKIFKIKVRCETEIYFGNASIVYLYNDKMLISVISLLTHWHIIKLFV